MERRSVDRMANAEGCALVRGTSVCARSLVCGESLVCERSRRRERAGRIAQTHGAPSIHAVATEAAATRRLPTTIYNLYADIDFPPCIS